MRRAVAAGAWLLGVAAAWGLLPPVPRATLTPAAAVSADGVAVRTQSRPPVPYNSNFLPPPFNFTLPGCGPVEGWDIATGRRLWSAHGPDDGIGTDWTADGRRLLVRLGRVDGWHADAIVVREAATGAVVGRFPGDTVFSPPDARLALVSRPDPADPSSNVPVYDLVETATGHWRRRLPGGPFPSFSPDGRRLLVPHYHRRGGAVYDTDTGRLVARFAEPRDPDWLGPDGRALIDPDGTVWDVDGHAARRRLQAVAERDGWVSPDGRWTSESLDGLDRRGRNQVVWTLVAGGERRVTPPAGFRVSSQSAADGGRLVTAYLERTRPAGPGGRWLAARSQLFGRWGRDYTDRRTWLLDPDTGAVVHDLPEGRHFIRRSADGRTLSTWAERDGGESVLEVWDVPARPSPWLVAGVAAGWGLVVVAVARQRPIRRLSSS